jgi:hypothetical protein
MRILTKKNALRILKSLFAKDLCRTNQDAQPARSVAHLGPDAHLGLAGAGPPLMQA